MLLRCAQASKSGREKEESGHDFNKAQGVTWSSGIPGDLLLNPMPKNISWEDMIQIRIEPRVFRGFGNGHQENWGLMESTV